MLRISTRKYRETPWIIYLIADVYDLQCRFGVRKLHNAKPLQGKLSTTDGRPKLFYVILSDLARSLIASLVISKK